MIENVGKYKIINEISRGGMGIVYLGMHPSLNRKVAIKMLPKELVSNKEFIQRFEREAKIVATLDHSNIVQVYDYEEAMGTYFIIMEFIDGKMLSDFMKKDKPMPQQQVTAIMSQMCGALAYAHSKGTIHRDIKPGNAMMRPDGVVKLMDFGIAFSQTSDVNLTQEGKVIGTPKYMSPEQLQGKKLDQRSDIYSLGVMCYEMVVGKPPFDGNDFITIASKHLKEKPAPIRSLVPDVSPELENFIDRSLIKDREKRLSSLSGLSLAGQKDEKTIYMDAVQKKGISRKFFYITLCIIVFLAAGLVIARHIKSRQEAQSGYKEQVEKITNKNVKALVEKAKTFFDKQDFTKSLVSLEKAQNIDPQNDFVKKAIKLTREKLVEVNMKKIRALEEKADAYAADKNHHDSISAWNEILLLDKNREDIHAKISAAESKLDEEQNRIEARKLLESGADMESSGDMEGAEKDYLAAYALDPKNGKAPYYLGLIYTLKFEGSPDKTKERETLKKAIQYFNKALELSPQHKGILKNLTIAYLTANQKEEAAKTAEKLKEIDEEEGKNLLDLIQVY